MTGSASTTSRGSSARAATGTSRRCRKTITARCSRPNCGGCSTDDRQGAWFRRYRDAERADAAAFVRAGGGGPLSGPRALFRDLPDHRAGAAHGGLSRRAGVCRRRARGLSRVSRRRARCSPTTPPAPTAAIFSRLEKPVAAFDGDTRAALDFLAGHPASTGRLGAIGHLPRRPSRLPRRAERRMCSPRPASTPTDIHDRALGKGGADDSLARAGDIQGELLMHLGPPGPAHPARGPNPDPRPSGTGQDGLHLARIQRRPCLYARRGSTLRSGPGGDLLRAGARPVPPEARGTVTLRTVLSQKARYHRRVPCLSPISWFVSIPRRPAASG